LKRIQKKIWSGKKASLRQESSTKKWLLVKKKRKEEGSHKVTPYNENRNASTGAIKSEKYRRGGNSEGGKEAHAPEVQIFMA